MEETFQIFTKVCQIIEGSVGIPKETINLDDTLFDKLGIDSIDMVDILYELELEYGVALKVSDIEAKAKEELGDIPYEVDGLVTEDGLRVLRKHMSEINPEEFKEGLTVHRLVQLFSVHSLCNIVQHRQESENG